MACRVASMAHESTPPSQMIKVLEAKYGDYGFFLGWEQDRTFGKFLKTQAGEASEVIQYYYQRHMPYKAGRLLQDVFIDRSSGLRGLYSDPALVFGLI